MKRVKQLFGVLLAVALMLSMAVTVSADTVGSILIKDNDSVKASQMTLAPLMKRQRNRPVKRPPN